MVYTENVGVADRSQVPGALTPNKKWLQLLEVSRQEVIFFITISPTGILKIPVGQTNFRRFFLWPTGIS